jgi:hypothetical protein
MGSIYHIVQPVSRSNAFELPKASYNVQVDQYSFHLHLFHNTEVTVNVNFI